MQSLSDLNDELSQLLDLLDSDDEDDRLAAEEILEDLMPQLVGKIDSYAGLIAHYDRIAGNIEAEISRLQDRKVRALGNRDKLKGRLQDFLEARVEVLGVKGKKLEGSLYKVSLVANGGKQPLYINPLANLNALGDGDAFVKTVVTESFDKDKIREMMVDQGLTELFGEDGVFVAELQPRGKHIKIS
jgi:Siphovirus Gp157